MFQVKDDFMHIHSFFYDTTDNVIESDVFASD